MQTTIGKWLARSDLTDEIPDFITLAEARLKRDSRLIEIATLDFVAAEDYALPGVYKALKELYHDGASNFGRIYLVSAAELSERKRRHGDTGVPRWVAVMETSAGRTLRFAPEPSGTYTLRMIYEVELEPLSDEDTTNWLLQAAPDLYLWASLSAAEGYLQEDDRITLWKQEYDQAANEYKKDKLNRQYSGPLTPRPAHIIGEDV